MHPCLNVDEIVRLIAGKLIESKTNATAIALACCCQSFEDPALDALWGTQDKLLPLLKSLPGDVWNEGGCTVSVSTTRSYIYTQTNNTRFLFPQLFVRKSFKRSPTTLEWARFRKYARRMRELKECWTSNTLSSAVFSVLQLCAIGEPLLPNLKTLDLWHITGKSIPFIPLFLSPRTTIIKIRFIPSNSVTATVAPMVTAFLALCPSLQEISLHSLRRDPVIIAAVSKMLLRGNRNALRCFNAD